MTREVLEMIDITMESDNETTAKEIQIKLQGMGKVLSKCTILTGRKHLGWTLHGTAYCQLIRVANEQKCLD